MDITNLYPTPADSPHQDIVIEGPGAVRIKCRACGQTTTFQGTDESWAVDPGFCGACGSTDCTITIASNATEAEIEAFIKEA